MTTSLDDLPVLLTPAELAILLRTTTSRLAQDRYLGRGVPFVRHGRKVLYDRGDVLGYLQANRCTRTDDPRGAA